MEASRFAASSPHTHGDALTSEHQRHVRLWWDLQATTRFCELRHDSPHSSQDDETVPAPESAWRSEMTGPFADAFVVDAANPLEKQAHMAFKRSLDLAQR